MDEFQTIKIRVCAIVQCGEEVALIRRSKEDGDSYTIPGGNIDYGEDIHEGLDRELFEELNIDVKKTGAKPIFLGMQDQMVSRPGATPSPRKIHMIFKLDVNSEARDAVSKTEVDDLGTGEIVWVNLKEVLNLHIYPAAHNLFSLEAEKMQIPTVLPAMNNKNFQWK